MEETPKRGVNRVFKGALMSLGVLAVFLLGFNVGNGNIHWNTNGAVSKDLPNRLDYSSVDKVYKALKDNYDGHLTETQLEDGLKHGLAASTKDPYTVYFTPQEAKQFDEELNNSFTGIGATIGTDDDGNIEVVAPIENLPAAKAGLQAKDIIVSINGTSTSGMSVDQAVNKIRGPKGSKVKLEVVRDKSQTLDFTITRDDIKLPSVNTKTLNGNIGYMQITSFSDDTVSLAQQAAQKFKDQNVKAVVLDLRNDPGGLLDAAIKVSSLWLPQNAKILDEKKGDKVLNSEYSTGNDILQGIPTVVLINDGSASASEITAGALHDNKAAYLIGEKSYGKGVVQQLINFHDGSQLKVTIASWYRPNGQNINKKGITPDKTVKLTDEDIKASNDTQLQAAEAYLNAQ
jgi:carboxyl-terminal processing protease